MHGSVRAQPILDREAVVLWVSARQRGQGVFVAGAEAVLFGDGEGVDAGLKLDGQAAERGIAVAMRLTFIMTLGK